MKTKDWDLWSGCKQKWRSENPLTAERKAKKHGKYVYLCRHCSHYHLTSKPQN